jgi:aryl-alcohol dehydrogenase-like predicted oxidoreductase
METRPVGVSGLQVSRLGLGTMTWGRDTSAEQARGLLETFCDAGGTLIDTAAAYGAGDS